MRIVQRFGLLTLPMLLVACGSRSEQSSTETRVITRVSDSNAPYPAARVVGRLSLQRGCLMIGQGAVFWPAGSSWDEASRAVVFGGDFEGAPAAIVDSTFTGGGGVFALDDDLSGVLSTDAEVLLRQCLDRTGATHALLAYP